VTLDQDGEILAVGPERSFETDGVTFRSSLAPNLTHFGSRTSFAGATFDNDVDHLTRFIDDPSSLKPMDPDRNDLAEGRVLGMPDYGLDEDEIGAVVRLLRSWE
jgi:cytochrome c1